MTQVSAELSLMQRDGTEFDEAAMAAAPPGSIGSLNSLDGTIHLISGDTRFDIGDTLLYAVSELCGTILPQLQSDGEAVYTAIANEEVLTFTRAGDRMTISSDYRAPVTLPAEATLAALTAAGKRLADLLPQLWPEADAGNLAETRATLTSGG